MVHLRRTPTNTVTITYDNGGRETSIADNSSSYAYTYDNDNRLKTVDDTGSPILPQVTLTYGYDNVGNETSLADSQGGVNSYTYDSRNELTTITQWGAWVCPKPVNMAHDAAAVEGLTRYADLTGTTKVAATSYAYDAANRLTALTNKTSAGSVISSYVYTLDAADRLTTESRTWNGGASTDTLNYTYTNNASLLGADAATSHSHRELRLRRQRQPEHDRLRDRGGEPDDQRRDVHLHLRRRGERGHEDGRERRRHDLYLRQPQPPCRRYSRTDLGIAALRRATYVYDAAGPS